MTQSHSLLHHPWRLTVRSRKRPPRSNGDPVSGQSLLSILVVLLTLAFSGCYQASLSQGNLIKQEDLDQVEVGMTRSQVRFLLGTPMIDDPFHTERWDYVYYLKIGRSDATFKRWVSIYFEGDNVSRIEKDKELAPDL